MWLRGIWSRKPLENNRGIKNQITCMLMYLLRSIDGTGRTMKLKEKIENFRNLLFDDLELAS